jgi:hypothetical protein
LKSFLTPFTEPPLHSHTQYWWTPKRFTMAPNLKRVSLLSQSLSSLQIVRPKDALQYQAPAPLLDSNSYWEWSEPTDLFSADHLTANLLSASKPSASCASASTIQAQNDEYWAEESSSASSKQHSNIEPLHLAAADSLVYFAETSYDGSIPSYWDEAMAPVHHHCNDCELVQKHDYWNEAVHHPTSDSDEYWAEESDALLFAQQRWRRYWNWEVDTCTRRDCYWIM